MGFFDRHLFADSRAWAWGQATGEVLEVAIGTGLNLEVYPEDVALTGIDWSEAMLDIARHRAAEIGRAVTRQQADAHGPPFDDATFDTVVCTFGLCAVPDHSKAIGEMARVLRPGGKLILVDHIESTSRIARGAQFVRAAGGPGSVDEYCGYCNVIKSKTAAWVKDLDALPELINIAERDRHRSQGREYGPWIPRRLGSV
jgi:ubiquinone/menaquinone biosynthesis C-methylase UbiE